MSKYGIGDKVKYGVYGECEIVDRREETIGGKTREFFILSQIKSTSTIFVPVEKAGNFRDIKNALTVDEIKALRFTKRNEIDWNADDKLRSERFREVFDRDATDEIAATLFALIERQSELKVLKKKLRAIETNAMKACEKILFDEFSRTLDLRPEDVTPILTGELEPVLK